MSAGHGAALDLAPPEVAAVPATVQPSASHGVALIIERLASNESVDVDKMERIIAMQERLMAMESKVAFDRAFAVMQGELPVIAERGKTDKGKYATLEDIVETVRPILCRHQFSLSHRTEWPDPDHVRIVGILSHSQGSEKTSEFLTIADKTGSKNAIQALGSALSYGRRYTTMDLLNIVTRGQDTDGQKAPPNSIQAPEGYQAWASEMDGVANCGLAAFRARWKDAPAAFRKHAQTHDPSLIDHWKAAATEADEVSRA